MAPDWILWLLLAAVLAGAMTMYEICRYGLVEEMIERKRWTAGNIRALVFGATVGTGLFIFAVQIANAILKRVGAW